MLIARDVNHSSTASADGRRLWREEGAPSESNLRRWTALSGARSGRSAACNISAIYTVMRIIYAHKSTLFKKDNPTANNKQKHHTFAANDEAIVSSLRLPTDAIKSSHATTAGSCGAALPKNGLISRIAPDCSSKAKASGTSLPNTARRTSAPPGQGNDSHCCLNYSQCGNAYLTNTYTVNTNVTEETRTRTQDKKAVASNNKIG